MFKAAPFGWISTLIIGALLFFGVNASAQTGTGSVTLAWTDTDPTVVGYDVYYGTVSGTYTNEVDVGDTTNATISGLQIGVTYYFAVAAYNSNGVESSLSSEVSYTVTAPAPTVTLTAPVNGAAYLAPATIVLGAVVTTNGNTINGVQFYNGATLLGTASNAPYALTWSGVSGGNYSLSAQVLYGTASTAASGVVTVTVTNPAPVVALTSPASGSSYAAPAAIPLAASVTTNGNSITRVQFFNGTTLLGTASTAPYAFTWNNVAAGSYSLSAKVDYNSGSVAASTAVSVSVTNPPPAITFTAPANGSSYLAPATITLSAGVTTNGHTINQVQFYNGSTLLGTVTTAPYTYTWSSVAAGSYTLSARLGYDSGSTASSGAINVTVTNLAPTIVLNAPTNGANYAAGSINLAATVNANGHSITKVSFYNSTVLLGSVTTSPYSYSWTNVAAGNYTLSAQLTYDSGSTLTSSSATVTVHPLPAISVISNQVMAASSTMPPIIFTVSDSETGASNLTLTASSDNPSVVSATNIVFGGSGDIRTATITSPGPTGSANITFTVSYGVASASRTFQLTVLPASDKPTAPTIITVNGPGSVTPNLDTQTLTLGQSYTVTATPEAGQTFTGWSGSVNSTNPTITFVFTKGFSLTANFVRSPYAKTSGTFSGLFYETNQTQVQSNSARALVVNQVQPSSAGAFSITVALSGAYSGHFQLGNKRYSFSGYLSDSGQSSQSIVRRGGSSLLLKLTMGTGTLADQVYGTLSDGTWTASLTGNRAVFDGHKHVAPYQGRYTLILPGQSGSSALPSGDGYGALHVTGSGLALFAGKLADGTPVSQSASVSSQGTWPLYVSLYAGNGLLTGWMDFTSEVADDLSGATTWIKQAQANAKYYPDGFTNEFETVGSAYVQAGATAPVLTLTNGMVEFSGGALGGAFTNAIAIAAHNRVTDLSGNPLRLSFIPGTGLFSGKVTDPSNSATLPFGGAVFQKLEAGYGFLLDAGQSSEVVIGNE